uniref:Uncharacterized protein n=1 Tax=Myoviridae sp. ctAca11 TaxID=2825043 RepID=A0A8S5Q6K0_9CAUD|nr:MAG TPA: hypothetical protein [Myoviridae sp. ctAca11]
MTKKQCIMIAIISAILTGVFMYLCYYFTNELAEVLFWIASTAFCFGYFYLVIALIWTQGEILQDPYPSFYLPDPYFEKKEKRDVH